MNARYRECLRSGVALSQLHAASCPQKGGGSESSNETTTQNIDKRLVVDSGIGISSDSSSVNVTALDAGAINEAFEFANANVELMKSADALQGQTAAQLLGLTDRVFTEAFKVLDKNASLVQSSGKLVSDAWDNAKGEGSTKTFLAYGVIAAVALVAVRSFGKGG